MPKTRLNGHPKPLPLDEPRTADLFAAYMAAPVGVKAAHVPNRGELSPEAPHADVESKRRAA